MRDLYIYRRAVRGPRQHRFRRRLLISVGFLIVLAAIGVWLALDLGHHGPQQSPPSVVQDSEVSDNIVTTSSPVFQFQDTGKWVLKKDESSSTKYIYYQYRGLQILHQLIFYVNQVPIPLYLDVSRALPVRLVNNDSLDVTSVTGHCVGQYAAGELHKVKLVTIEGAEMLCDPDTPQYSIILTEIGGNYQLKFKRPGGEPLQLIVTYRDLTNDIRPDTIIRIAKSLKII